MAATKKPGILSRISRYIKDAVGEMKKVVWPSKEQALKNTGVVLIFTVVIALVIWGIDSGLWALIKLMFLGKV